MTRYLALSNYVAYCMDAGMTLEEIEIEVRREVVRKAILRSQGFQSRAKGTLGVHRHTMCRLVREFAPDSPKKGGPYPKPVEAA